MGQKSGRDDVLPGDRAKLGFDSKLYSTKSGYQCTGSWRVKNQGFRGIPDDADDLVFSMRFYERSLGYSTLELKHAPENFIDIAQRLGENVLLQEPMDLFLVSKKREETNGQDVRERDVYAATLWREKELFAYKPVTQLLVPEKDTTTDPPIVIDEYRRKLSALMQVLLEIWGRETLEREEGEEPEFLLNAFTTTDDILVHQKTGVLGLPF